MAKDKDRKRKLVGGPGNKLISKKGFMLMGA